MPRRHVPDKPEASRPRGLVLRVFRVPFVSSRRRSLGMPRPLPICQSHGPAWRGPTGPRAAPDAGWGCPSGALQPLSAVPSDGRDDGQRVPPTAQVISRGMECAEPEPRVAPSFFVAFRSSSNKPTAATGESTCQAAKTGFSSKTAHSS